MTRGCLAGTAVCFVSNAGDIYPCGYLPVSAGNVRQERFGDIWAKSPVFEQLRDPSTLTGKCGICRYEGICGGCRARAFSDHGDYLAEEPFCTYEPILDNAVALPDDGRAGVGSQRQRLGCWWLAAGRSRQTSVSAEPLATQPLSRGGVVLWRRRRLLGRRDPTSHALLIHVCTPSRGSSHGLQQHPHDQEDDRPEVVHHAPALAPSRAIAMTRRSFASTSAPSGASASLPTRPIVTSGATAATTLRPGSVS